MSALAFPLRWAVYTSTNKPTRAELQNGIKIIQSEEVNRIGKFYFQRDAHSSLIGRLLLRKCIADVFGVKNKEIIFQRDNYNKPILLSPSLPHFHLNVSHQGDYVVLAAHNSIRIGIDVMKLEYSGGKDVSEFFRLMERQFSAKEWINIRKGGGDGENIKNFMRYWTLKESYVKAVGLGLNLDLERIEFQTLSDLSIGQVVNDSFVKVDGQLLTNWTFEEHYIDSEHVVAIAMETPRTELEMAQFKLLSFQNLIHNQDFLTESQHEDFVEKYFKKPEQPSGRK